MAGCMKDILPVADIVRRLHELNPDGVPKSRWLVNNRERVYKKIRAWQKANPDRRRAHARPSEQRRRAVLKGSIGSFTPQEWDSLIEVYKHRCAYCGKKTKRLTVDHIIPLSKGGENFISNIIPACSYCNSSKHDRLWDAQLALNTAPRLLPS